MEKKMTKKDYFNQLLTIVDGFNELAAVVDAEPITNTKEVQDFIAHEIELLDKKSSKSTKTQVENEKVMVEIVQALAAVGKRVTVSELMKSSEIMSQYTNQKLSALLKKLVDNGEVVRVTEKKKSYFSLVPDEMPTEDEETVEN